MKTAISISNDVFTRAENFARKRRLTRSALFTRAVEEFLSHHQREGVTERLNRLYEREDSRLDPVIARLQTATILKEKW